MVVALLVALTSLPLKGLKALGSENPSVELKGAISQLTSATIQKVSPLHCSLHENLYEGQVLLCIKKAIVQHGSFTPIRLFNKDQILPNGP
jgi:hypothetical protein